MMIKKNQDLFRDLLKAPPCPSLLRLSQTKILFSSDSKIITNYQDNNPRSLLTLSSSFSEVQYVVLQNVATMSIKRRVS